MRDVKIHHAWLGDALMGVGLTEAQAGEDARAAGRKTIAWGGGVDGSMRGAWSMRGAFETAAEYMAALEFGADWLSECSQEVISLLDTREVEE